MLLMMSKKYNSGRAISFILQEISETPSPQSIFRSWRGNIIHKEKRVYTIGIIVFDDVLTSEVIAPAEVFALAGEKVLLIGVENQATIRTEEGIRLGVDCTIADDVTLDVLIVPGAGDVAHLQSHEKLTAFIRNHEKSAQWLGSMCAGAFVLGSAGVLDGKQATTWFGGETTLQAQFPKIAVVEDKPVVVDNRVITANGGLVGYRAALILLGKLVSIEVAQKVYQGLSMGRMGNWEAIAGDIVA
jgi:transcriptional regulator GlxA family with amidase domain